MSSITSLQGLSGYDFSSIISMEVDKYKQPLTRMQTEQSSLQTKQSAWQEIKTALSALNTTLTALKDADTWAATKATSSNTSLLTATGTSGGVAGTYNVKISRLAEAQSAVTREITASGTKSALKIDGNAVTGGDWTFKINGKDVTVKATASTTDGGGNTVSALSLADMQNAINSANAGVKASIVQVNDGAYRLALTSTKTGEANVPVFDVTGDSADLFNDLGITLDGSGKIAVESDPDTGNPILFDPNATGNSSKGGITVIGADAQFSVNGLTITNSSNKVTTAIPGVTLNLLEADSSKNIAVQVEDDYSVAEKAIQNFVDKYNSLVNLINSKTAYNSTTQVAGTLMGDSTIENIKTYLRSVVGGVFNVNIDGHAGDFDILSEIGVSTSSTNYGKDGTLEFDTKKFREAMEQNIQSVANLFGAEYGGSIPRETSSNSDNSIKAQGLANIFSEYFSPMLKFQGSLDKLNDSFKNQLTSIADRIADFEDRAADYEERVRLKYARLETALAALSQQSSSLSSVIASLSASKK